MSRMRFGGSYGVRGKSYLPNYEMSFSRVEFQILEDKQMNRAGELERVGRAKFTYTTLDRVNNKRSGEIEVTLPAICIWSDGEKGEVVKAHLTINMQDLQAVRFYWDLATKAKKADGQNYFTLVASAQRVIRYGRDPNYPYHSDVEADGSYMKRYFYDSRTAAMEAILSDMQNRQLRNLGGINIASFLGVPDELLQQVGFVKVPDCMERGIPMWMGDPAIFKETEQEARWRSSDKKKLDEVLDSFLNGLQKALQAA